MKRYKLFKLILASILFNLPLVNAQSFKTIFDKHISNQQERMVFKQWDSRKFTPTKGFLGLNYEYWLTWGLHPNYPKTDRRPLSAGGPQTLRIAMMLAMRQSTTNYKLHSDTISAISLAEMVNYSPLISTIDPLWNMYYKSEFGPLANENHVTNPLNGLNEELKRNLIEKGVLKWYMEEYEILKYRLHTTHNTTLDRGSRIISYHRILEEYRSLQSNWQAKIQNMVNYIALLKKTHVTAGAIHIKHPHIPKGQTDIQIAQKILSRAYSQ